jgi:hypothetical protein
MRWTTLTCFKANKCQTHLPTLPPPPPPQHSLCSTASHLHKEQSKKKTIKRANQAHVDVNISVFSLHMKAVNFPNHICIFCMSFQVHQRISARGSQIYLGFGGLTVRGSGISGWRGIGIRGLFEICSVVQC